ncbi:MAG: molybdopterin-binding protein, partial [Spirochaetes bacterium]|nr:molybdopterin-binding protein [Spirochaetota bacterium]
MVKNKIFKIIKVDDAVGKVLPHDITRIVPGKVKGAAFRKGHIIRKQDIKKLKSLGKEHIYTINMPKDHYHEDEAALKFRKLGGKNIKTTGPLEGKVQFIAACSGFLKINKEAVNKINGIEHMVFTTIHSDIPVKKNDKIAGIRIIPLIVDKKAVQKVLKIGSVPPLSIAPFKKKKVGLIVTGEEVASG